MTLFSSRSGHAQSSDNLFALLAFARAHTRQAQYYLLRAAHLPYQPLESQAIDREVIAPAETIPYIRPRMIPAHLERMRASSVVDEPISDLIARVLRDEWSHDASIAYTVPDAALIGSKIYSGRMKHDLYKGRLPRLNEVETLDHVLLASTYSGAYWFGHVIHDDFPVQLLAAEREGLAVGHARPMFRDEPSYRRLFGVPEPRILPGFFARRCTIYMDYAQNADKRARYARMQANVPRSSGPETRAYIQRVGGEQRKLSNEAELMHQLEKGGFTILSTGTDTPERMAEVLSGACQLVSLDGSHAVGPCFTLPRGAEVCLILPPYRCVDTLENVCQAAGLQTAMFVGEAHGENEFSVDVDELLAFLDQAKPAPEL